MAEPDSGGTAPPGITEVRIHGRGGQGNVAAAYLLAAAAIREGRFAQAFPAFGAERRGAPVVAYVRIAERRLRRRSQVQHPAFLIIQDAALMEVPGVLAGLLPGGGVLVNSAEASDALEAHLGVPTVALPAGQMAQEVLGRPVPNTALLAAFLTLTDVTVAGVAGGRGGRALPRQGRAGGQPQRGTDPPGRRGGSGRTVEGGAPCRNRLRDPRPSRRQ